MNFWLNILCQLVAEYSLPISYNSRSLFAVYLHKGNYTVCSKLVSNMKFCVISTWKNFLLCYWTWTKYKDVASWEPDNTAMLLMRPVRFIYFLIHLLYPIANIYMAIQTLDIVNKPFVMYTCHSFNWMVIGGLTAELY